MLLLNPLWSQCTLISVLDVNLPFSTEEIRSLLEDIHNSVEGGNLQGLARDVY